MEYGVTKDHIGVFDWDEAFRQNPGEPVFYVSPAERARVHTLETTEEAAVRLRRMQKRKNSGTQPFSVVTV